MVVRGVLPDPDPAHQLSDQLVICGVVALLGVGQKQLTQDPGSVLPAHHRIEPAPAGSISNIGGHQQPPARRTTFVPVHHGSSRSVVGGSDDPARREPGRMSPPFIATQIELAKRVGVPATLPVSGPA